MLFMDWRDSHLKDVADLRENNKKLPTFLYAMPFTKSRIFVEETSLVARPALNFDELKDRMYARLKHLGIEVCTHLFRFQTCIVVSICREAWSQQHTCAYCGTPRQAVWNVCLCHAGSQWAGYQLSRVPGVVHQSGCSPMAPYLLSGGT
jgi:hypothetical protein